MKSRRKTKSAPGSSNELLPKNEQSVYHSPPKVVRNEPRTRTESTGTPRRRTTPREEETRAPPRKQAPTRAPRGQAFPGVDVENEVQEDNANHKCNGCGRTFNETAFGKHQKLCKKVFQDSRKVFNSKVIILTMTHYVLKISNYHNIMN